MSAYKCPLCGKVVDRNDTANFYASFCIETGKPARLERLKQTSKKKIKVKHTQEKPR